jgi:hypothetical protein
MKVSNDSVKEPKISTGGKFFLGWGFHKVRLVDFSLRKVQTSNGEYLSVRLVGGTEPIPGFKGYEGVDYMKLTFQPFSFGITSDAEALLRDYKVYTESTTKPAAKTEASKAYWSGYKLDAILKLARAAKVNLDAIDTPTVELYITAVLNAIKSKGTYFWVQIKEEDELSQDGTKVYTNNYIDFNTVFALEEVVSCDEDDAGFHIVYAKDNRTGTYEKNQWNYKKRTAAPNDAPNQTNSAPSAPQAPTSDNTYDDLPF